MEECVAIFMSEFDRGHGDPPNIVGVILEIKDKKYKIGTKAGIVSNCWKEMPSNVYCTRV